MKFKYKILLPILAFFIFIVVPLSATGAMWVRNVGLLPGSAVVFASDSPVIDRFMAGALKPAYGNRIGICDGTDDHVQSQAAIDALPATGGEVRFFDGTYNIEAALVLDSYQTLRGCGRNTILTTTTAFGDIIYAIGGAGAEKVGILIADLCIDGAAGGSEVGVPIYFEHVDYSRATGVWVRNGCDYCIFLTQSDNNIISNNIFSGAIYPCLYMDNSDNNTISGNNFGGAGEQGIYLDSCRNNIFSGNICQRNSQSADNTYDNIYLTGCGYNLIEGNLCRAPTIGTTLTVGEPIAETDIAVTNTASFEVGMGVVIDLGGVDEEYHRISAITAGTPGIITIDAGLTNNQGAGEPIDVPEARYGINISSATCDGDLVIGNDLYDSGKTANFNDAGTGTRLATYIVPFSDGTDPQDSGYEIDANTEMARAWLRLPPEVQQIVRMKVYARSVVAETHEMELEMVILGGADNEPFGTHDGSIAQLDSASINFAADDIIFWINTEAGTLALVGGDSVEVKVLHEAAEGDNCETDAFFRTVEIEYV